MIKADLHIHSEHSPDGELSVKEILNSCKQADLSIVSITDHNLVKGIPEALAEGTALDIKVIPGIEIDCNYQGIDLHLLGYHIHWNSVDFGDLGEEIARKTMDSFDLMVKNLSRAGITVDPSEVLAKAQGRLPTAELIAEVLLGNDQYNGVEKLNPYRAGGDRSDMPFINFYLDYFAQGKPAYVKLDYMDFNDAVFLVKANGGLAVVAHPGLNLPGREEMMMELIEKGADGMEVFNNYHSPEQMQYFGEMAVQRNLLMTCGSDFHGKTKPLIKPGVYGTVKQFEGYADDCTLKLMDYTLR